MLALPVALLLGFFDPAVSIPIPQFGSEAESEEIQLPRKSGGLRMPWAGASLFPVEENEAGSASVDGKRITGLSLSKPLSFGAWAVVVWVLGFMVLLGRELLGVAMLHRRRSVANPVSPSLLNAWKYANHEMGSDVPENSIMQLPDETASPYLTPWPFTKLLIPEKLEERFSEAEIGHLFHDEAAHLAGRDPAALFVMRMIACSLWFFPGVWWLARKHLNLCEECADARAAGVGGVESYREAVASFALEFVPSKSTRVMALLKKATVVERLKVLSGNVSKSQPSARQKGGLVLVLFFTLAGIGRVGLAEVDDTTFVPVVLPIDPESVPVISTSGCDDPSDLWYRGFLKVKKAEELEKQGASDAGVINLNYEALVIYKALAADYPTYLPEIVTERNHLIRGKIATLKGRLKGDSGAPVHIAPSALAEPVLKIRGITGKWDVDDSQGRKITLVVDIASASSANVRFNPALMSLKVVFYELVASTRLVPSIGEIETRYPTEPYDWEDGEIETIEIDYFLPEEVAENTKREYYGRIIELYYKGTLQEVVASPSKLVRLVE